jgi:hypothetical protein
MKNIVAGILFILPFAAQAGSSYGTVASLVVNVYDQVLISTSDMTNLDACATVGGFIADLKAEHGKAMYAILLSAQAQHKRRTNQ